MKLFVYDLQNEVALHYLLESIDWADDILSETMKTVTWPRDLHFAFTGLSG